MESYIHPTCFANLGGEIKRHKLESISETELAYIAGFFDGEGTVGVYARKARARNKSYWSLYIIISQVNPIPLIKIRDLFGGGIYSAPQKTPTGEEAKLIWKWTISDRKAEYFLRNIIDYLIVKKEEATLALAFMDIPRKQGKPASEQNLIRKENISNRIKELKKQEWATLPM